MVADKRLIHLLHGEGDGFKDVNFDGERGRSAVFKGSIIPGFPNVEKNGNED